MLAITRRMTSNTTRYRIFVRRTSGTRKFAATTFKRDIRADGFVRRVFAGGAAEAAGLRRGDRIEAAAGRPFHPVRSFRGQFGKVVELKVPNGDRCSAGSEVGVRDQQRPADHRGWKPATRNEGSQNRGGRRIGYCRIFCGAGEEFEMELRRTLQERLAGADGLCSLDFRDGWAGAIRLSSMSSAEPRRDWR